MPIKLFDGDASLPPECRPYSRLLWQCSRYTPYRENPGRTAYLTIQEAPVPVGRSQRRPGLHIERPGPRSAGAGQLVDMDRHNPGHMDVAWGLGRWEGDLPVDGIFTASTVSDSCAVWPALVKDPGDDGVVDAHGGIEHMRERLGAPVRLEAGQLCWLTDRTPHESLPLQPPPDDPGAQTVYRQFFRLVVGPISVWYAQHSTPNPLGILPDAPISHVNKFDETA